MPQVPDHEIQLKLVSGFVRPDPTNILVVGQTVRYCSPDGKARIVFPTETPYTVNVVHDSEVHTLTAPGRFGFQCFVTPHGSTKEIGWNPADPKAGGEHDVVPPPAP